MKSPHKSVALRSFLAFLFTINLNSFGAVPAQAVFGLGTCEKVKKEITTIEKKINIEIMYWNSYLNEVMNQGMLSRREVFEKKRYPYQIWKIAYNNPKCFTRTQNIEVQRRTEIDAKYKSSGIIAYRGQTIGYGAECKGLPTYTIDLGKYGKSKHCTITPRLIVQETQTFESVYSF